MATHSSSLAWRIPWTEKPSGLQSMGSQKCWTRLKQLNKLRKNGQSYNNQSSNTVPGFQALYLWSQFFGLQLCASLRHTLQERALYLRFLKPLILLCDPSNLCQSLCLSSQQQPCVQVYLGISIWSQIYNQQMPSRMLKPLALLHNESSFWNLTLFIFAAAEVF